jgi:hypothetical protein
MKTTSLRLSLLFTIILLYSSVILVGLQSSQPHAADAMWVEPSPIVFSTTNASIGTEFNVTVCLNMTEDVFAYQIGLHYNRTQLMCNRANYTAGATSDYFKGHKTISSTPVIDGAILGNGSVLATETVYGPDFIPGPHNGSLIWAEFEILAAPAWGSLTSKLDISSEYPTRTWVWNTTKNNLAFTPYDGIYTFIRPPEPLVVSISANSTLISVGQSVFFTSTVTGGSPPYIAYQWLLNSTAVPGATSACWTYKPTTTGSANVCVNVTDSNATTTQSNVITLVITPVAPKMGPRTRMQLID